ncbi:MAG: helix-turn-helix domain containing protein [Acidimicrobiales bacterium]|nr:helix-turn-helix domain containing protein [Acidimicrobiales bacterium]
MNDAPKPRGAVEVRAALLAAGARLLGERPPGRISGRDLAEEAGVNYGLIHHYFGSKESVLREALASLATSYAAGDPDGGWSATDPFSMSHRLDYLRALAFASLTGQLADLTSINPVLEASLADVARRRGAVEPDEDIRIDVGVGAVYHLGYCLFEDFLAESLGLDDGDREAVEERLRLILRAIVLGLDVGEAARGMRAEVPTRSSRVPG